MTRTVTYLLPIKADHPPAAELTDYLLATSRVCTVVIVDGSVPAVFDAAQEAWSGFATHIPPDPQRWCLNGKVHGVLTGLAAIDDDIVVIADDDVRWDPRDLEAIRAAMAGVDLVVPQNHFSPLPWHARWDSGRTLLNRVVGGDFPGTLVLRPAALGPSRSYDGDVLFENLELMRTVAARGGTVRRRPDLYVRRLPPTTRRFLDQRKRQAYDDLALPIRFACWLGVVPAAAFAIARHRSLRLAAAALATVGIAEAGRRRQGGRERFHWTCSLFAPLWIAERAVCAWCAVALRMRGGVRYSHGRITTAANSRRVLARRLDGVAEQVPNGPDRTSRIHV